MIKIEYKEMTRKELAGHYRKVLFETFKCSDMTGLPLIKDMMNNAIELLKPHLDNIQRPMSDEERKKYTENGIDISWNLSIPEDAIRFYRLVHNNSAYESYQNAAYLISLCHQAIEYGRVSHQDKASQIISCYLELSELEGINKLNNSKGAKDQVRKKMWDDIKYYWKDNRKHPKNNTKEAEAIMDSDVYKKTGATFKKEVISKKIGKWRKGK